MEEVEIKILEINEEKIIKRLIDLRAKHIKTVHQKDTLYKNKHIKENNLKVRLREEDKDAFFTIKTKAIVRDKMKVAEEYEIPVKEPKKLHELFLMMGLKEKLIVTVFRMYYRLENCSVEIIRHPLFPTYLEIEGLQEDIRSVASKLGFSEADFFAGSIRTHYLAKK